MATVRSYVTDALMEIGALAQGETPSAADAQLALRTFQRQLDSWQAEYTTLAIQKRVTFTLSSGATTVTIGPTGGDVTAVRPVFLSWVNYIIPGSSPDVEVPIGIMDRDAFAGLSIKEQTSQLPLQCFYQTSVDSVLGTLQFWPEVTQDVDIVLYYPSGIATPATLDDVLLAPPGYAEAFLYQLAKRLLTPFAVGDQGVIGRVYGMAEESFARMKRPNLQPGVMGVDAALVPMSGGAYNVLSDGFTGSSGR